MKKFILSSAIILLLQESQLEAQVTSPTFDPVWAAKFQNAISSALPTSGIHGVSVAITFPGMGTFIGVAGESAPGIPMTPDMQFAIGSNTKLFTAVLALKLQELGILSLDDPLSAWLPYYPNINGSATIRQCLLHETGFFDYKDIPDDSVLLYGPQQFYTQQQVLQRVGPPLFEVGREMRYSNTNYNLVALAMESAAGKTYSELLHQYIFDPLRLDSTFLGAYESPNGNLAHGWYLNDDLGTTPRLTPISMWWSAGGIYSTASEMVQWYDNLFAGNIINQSSLQQMTYFDQTTWYALGLQYLSPPFLPDDDVLGHIGGVYGYTGVMGYDVKRRSSLCLLTNQGDDGVQFPNVLVPLVTQLYFEYTRRVNDAGITKILSPISQICNGSFSPEVLLHNFGSSNLQSVKINYQVDDGGINTYDWTGTLLKDATTSVALPSISAPAGNHSFRAFTSLPNGNTEGYDYNDGASSKFTVNNGPFATSIDEGFEGPSFPAGWQNGNNTVYDWGQSNVGYFANGSSKGIGRNNFDDGTERSYDLELPYLNLSADNNPVLSFNYAYGFNKSCPQCLDELTVLISKDCGKTYHPLMTKKGQALKTSNTNTFHYPLSNEWGTTTVNLSAYKTNVFIKFRMTNGFGNLFYLDNIKVANVSAICQTPTDLDELQVTSSSVKLSWKFQGIADHFAVYYRPRGSDSWSHKTVAGNKQWTDVSGLTPGTDYEWNITAACTTANSMASPYSFFTTGSSLAQKAETTVIDETKETFGSSLLKIAPNPASSSATISFMVNSPGKILLSVYDINGRLVATLANREFAAGEQQLKWNTSNVNAGVYLIRLHAQSLVQTKKLILIK
jgi:CubicO group peptidase (beta-lactamase class C family)